MDDETRDFYWIKFQQKSMEDERTRAFLENQGLTVSKLPGRGTGRKRFNRKNPRFP